MVLFTCHNHPSLIPGGVEVCTQDVYKTLQNSPGWDCVLLARAGRPFTTDDADHSDTPFASIGPDPNQYLLYTDFGDYDYFLGRLVHTKQVLTRHYRDFLLARRPDVVHFQHTAYMGYDIVQITRNALPDVPLVWTLHEFLPICNRDGQMLRVEDDALCTHESPRRCHECFPDISPQAFYMRKRFIQSHLRLIDCFIAPSEYVAERFCDWGVPENRIEIEAQSFLPIGNGVASRNESGGQSQASGGYFWQRIPEHRGGLVGSRNKFAYFGQLNPYKGADVLLKAMDLLGEDFDGHLSVFGANLEMQKAERWRERFEDLVGVERENVTFVGRYQREELPNLMAGIDWVVVPSIWWETGPLVVWEAFQCGRPVICSDIGGMSEKVIDDVNGMHFKKGDAADLAAKMRRATETPGLWDQLRRGIPPDPGHPMGEHVSRLTAIYSRLLAERPPTESAEGLVPDG